MSVSEVFLYLQKLLLPLGSSVMLSLSLTYAFARVVFISEIYTRADCPLKPGRYNHVDATLGFNFSPRLCHQLQQSHVLDVSHRFSLFFLFHSDHLMTLN